MIPFRRQPARKSLSVSVGMAIHAEPDMLLQLSLDPSRSTFPKSRAKANRTSAAVRAHAHGAPLAANLNPAVAPAAAADQVHLSQAQGAFAVQPSTVDQAAGGALNGIADLFDGLPAFDYIPPPTDGPMSGASTAARGVGTTATRGTTATAGAIKMQHGGVRLAQMMQPTVEAANDRVPKVPTASQLARAKEERQRWLPLTDKDSRSFLGITLTRRLGSGGFATVFEAKDNMTGELYAFKISTKPLMILEEGASLDDAAVEQQLGKHWEYKCCQRELSAYMKLNNGKGDANNRGIPELHDEGLLTLSGGRVHSYLTMQLLGKTVYHEIQQGRTASDKQYHLRLAHGMLNALEFMHTGPSRMVHRDVKPGNFCVNPKPDGNPAVYILDFGFANDVPTLAAADAAEDGGDGYMWEAFEGTPDYASSNALRSVRQGPRDDLESLGYGLLEMWNGVLEWDVTDPNLWSCCAPSQPGGHAKDLEWTDENLERMADMRDRAFKELVEAGRVPKFLVNWIQYCKDLQPFEVPNYKYLHFLLASAKRSIKPAPKQQASSQHAPASSLPPAAGGIPQGTAAAATGAAANKKRPHSPANPAANKRTHLDPAGTQHASQSMPPPPPPYLPSSQPEYSTTSTVNKPDQSLMPSPRARKPSTAQGSDRSGFFYPDIDSEEEEDGVMRSGSGASLQLQLDSPSNAQHNKSAKLRPANPAHEPSVQHTLSAKAACSLPSGFRQQVYVADDSGVL